MAPCGREQVADVYDTRDVLGRAVGNSDPEFASGGWPALEIAAGLRAAAVSGNQFLSAYFPKNASGMSAFLRPAMAK